MLRLPLPTIAVWLSLGAIAGWWLHAFYQSPTFPAIEFDLPGRAPDPQTQQRDIVTATLPKTEIETLIEQGEYELAFARFGATRARDERITRQSQHAIITSLSKLSEESPAEAQVLLRRFLEEDAYNPRGLLLLGETYFKTGQHTHALETLFNLKSFNQAEIPEENIDSLIEQIESKYTAQLRENGHFDKLLHLYEFLTTHDPADLARFYKLAEIQLHLHHYYDALTSLNYVLYDPAWNKLAQSLADDIQQFIDLDDEIQVPLKRVGEHFIVNASLNGIEGARLMIDTGASLCVLRPQTAQQFGLPTDSDDYITLNLVAGVVNAPRIEIDTLSIGDAAVRNIKASVIEMPPGVDSDGLLGMNFLNNFKFFIDQKREILYLGSR